MIASVITYVVLAISGLLGSVIAWDDLKSSAKTPSKPVAKSEEKIVPCKQC